MTHYERGYAAGLKAAAEVCKVTADLLPPGPFTGLCAETLQSAEQRILSIHIAGEADQRAKGEDSRTERSCENGAAHPNPGEPVAQVMYEMANDGKCGPVAWFKSPRSLPDGTMLYSHPARPGPSQECVMVPNHVFDAAINYIKHVGCNFTERGIPHPQEKLLNAMLAAKEE